MPGAVPRDPVDWARHGDEPISVLVVDDQESFLTALREVVAATEGFELVGEAASGEQALAAADELSPQLVIMQDESEMPGLRRPRGNAAAYEPPSEYRRTNRLGRRAPRTRAALIWNAAGFIRKQDGLAPCVLMDLWREHTARESGDNRPIRVANRSRPRVGD